MFSNGYRHLLLSKVICICLAKVMAIYVCPKSFAYAQQRLWTFTFVQSHLHMFSKGYGHLFTFVQSHLHMFSKGYGHLVLPKVVCVCLAKVMAIYFCPKSFAYVQQRLWRFTFVQCSLHMFSRGYGHLLLSKVSCICIAKVMAI